MLQTVVSVNICLSASCSSFTISSTHIHEIHWHAYTQCHEYSRICDVYAVIGLYHTQASPARPTYPWILEYRPGLEYKPEVWLDCTNRSRVSKVGSACESTFWTFVYCLLSETAVTCCLPSVCCNEDVLIEAGPWIEARPWLQVEGLT